MLSSFPYEMICPAENTLLMKIPLQVIEHLLIQNIKFKLNVMKHLSENVNSSYQRLIDLLGME
jgi:hypothetical protein